MEFYSSQHLRGGRDESGELHITLWARPWFVVSCAGSTPLCDAQQAEHMRA